MTTNKLKINFVWMFFLVAMLSIPSALNAQKSIFDVMNYKEVLEITLEADFSSLDTNRRSDESIKALLSFEDSSGNLQKWNIKLKARGNFRRLRCEMVPFKMEFKKKELEAAGLATFDDMKVVTHCIDKKREAKSLIQKEYLTYRLYNELTDHSYRVLLMKVNYKDTATGKVEENWAILIEDSAQLKARIGATADCDNCINLPKDTFHNGFLRITQAFQYMIGNSDWDLNVGRNVKFFAKEGLLITIPYDFDFSGLVNAPYAIANPNYGLKSVRDRVFIGFDDDRNKMSGTFSYFKTKRENLIKKVEEFKELSWEEQKDIIIYLNSFYDDF